MKLNIISVAVFMNQGLYCPKCKKQLTKIGNGYSCQYCSCLYPVADGIATFVDRKISIDSFPASAFGFLFEMEQKHFWHIGRKEIILDVLKRNVPNLMESRMLEVGCGNGSILAYLKQNGVNIEGGDVFIECLKYCQQRLRHVNLYHLNILSLPFIADFDIIGSFDVLEHIDEDERALAEISQALRPGGKIILTVPAYKFLWSYYDELSKHRRRYSKGELITKLERNGFIINKISFYMFFLFPVILLIRGINRTLRKKSANVNVKNYVELKTVPVLNQIFLGLLRLEKWLMRWINLPFGSSLLILAEKK